MKSAAAAQPNNLADRKYHLAWTAPDGSSATSIIEAHIRPYVDALTVDGAVKLFLEFGGAPLYVSDDPQAGSRIVELLGREPTIALARAFGGSQQIRVPLASRFIARVLEGRGVPRNEIARTLRLTDLTVRSYLSARPRSNKRDWSQIK